MRSRSRDVRRSGKKPSVDGSNPAIYRRFKSRISGGDRDREFYFVASSVRKSVCTLVRQLCVYFRAANARALVNAATGIVWQLAHHGKPTTSEGRQLHQRIASTTRDALPIRGIRSRGHDHAAAGPSRSAESRSMEPDPDRLGVGHINQLLISSRARTSGRDRARVAADRRRKSRRHSHRGRTTAGRGTATTGLGCVTRFRSEKSCRQAGTFELDPQPNVVEFRGSNRNVILRAGVGSFAITGGNLDVVQTDASGKTVVDTKAERLKLQTDDLDDLSAKAQEYPVLGIMLESFSTALNEPDSEFVRLYQIRDALVKRFGQSVMRKRRSEYRRQIGSFSVKWQTTSPWWGPASWEESRPSQKCDDRRAGEDEGVGRGLDPIVRGDALTLLLSMRIRVLYWRLELGRLCCSRASPTSWTKSP